jgi:phage gpG-like protein
MSTNIEWHGDEAMELVREKAARGLSRAAMEVRRRAAQLLSLAGTANSTGGGGKRKGSRITGAVRSAPGEPPRKQTGRLRASVTYEVSGLEARVGTNVKYGKYLELGTKRGISPRPWLRRALAECQQTIGQLLLGDDQ